MIVEKFQTLGAVLLLFLFAALSIPVQSAFAAGDPGVVAREILEAGDYQTVLEIAPTREQSKVSRDWSWLQKALSFTEGMAPALRAVLYILCAAAVVLILFAVLKGLMAWLRRGEDTPIDDEDMDYDGPVRTRRFDSVGTLSDADALAAQGRFAEAVRVLLFRSLEFLRTGIGDAVFPFLTSREILLVSGLDSAERDALRRIVATEEIAHFGEASLNADAYQTCRADFLVFSRQGPEGAT